MNSKILIISVAVVLVLGVGYYFLSSGNSDALPEQPTATSTAELKTVSGVYQIDPNQSQANWSGSKTLIANYVDIGTIGIKTGKVSLSQGQILSGEIIFDMTSITASKTGRNSGETNLTKHLKSDDFFSVEKYPEAKFVVNEISTPDTNNTYNLNGNLTIKAKTAPVSIPVRVTVNSDGTLKATGQVEIDRTIWDVRYGSGKFFQDLGDNVIDDKFTLQFDLTANPTEPAAPQTTN